jgi:hypothetical protein
MNTDTIPRSRRTDALTSREAAQSMVMVAATHRALIWNALRTAGPAGRFEIAELTGLDPVQVARRVAELVSQGLLRRVPRRTETTPSGRTGGVWEVTA